MRRAQCFSHVTTRWDVQRKQLLGSRAKLWRAVRINRRGVLVIRAEATRFPLSSRHRVPHSVDNVVEAVPCGRTERMRVALQELHGQDEQRADLRECAAMCANPGTK